MTIDPSVLEEYRAMMGLDGDAFLAELVTTYLDNASQSLQRLRDAVANGDTKLAARLAHNLKGGSLSVGANGIAELAAGIEESARRESLEGAAEHTALLAQEFAAVAAALRALAGLPPPG